MGGIDHMMSDRLNVVVSCLMSYNQKLWMTN